MRQPKTEPTLEAIARKLDSLFNHVTSLDRSVQVLSSRLQPFDEEDIKAIAGRQVPPIIMKRTPSLESVFEKIRTADNHIEEIERDVARIRSLLEGMDGDSQLRDDLMPYFKKRPTR